MKSSARGIAPIMVLLMVLMAGRKGEASVERPHSDGTKKMLRVVGTGLAGVAVVYALGTAASTFVPLAMTKCGVVAKGVGTLHASYAAGGLAAKLQAFAHVVLQKKAVLVWPYIAATAALTGVGFPSVELREFKEKKLLTASRVFGSFLRSPK